MTWKNGTAQEKTVMEAFKINESKKMEKIFWKRKLVKNGVFQSSKSDTFTDFNIYYSKYYFYNAKSFAWLEISILQRTCLKNRPNCLQNAIRSSII